jgi:multimeric flavodoxin WrbA
MAAPDIRKEMPPVKLPREEFETRYRSRFVDPAFQPLQRELDAIVAAAWDAYSHSRKAPHTRKAGPGFADPEYEISVDWLAAREAILEAQRRHDDTASDPRILVINGSARSEHTCPGESSKTWRLVKLVEPIFAGMGFAVDILDLSRLTSEYGRQIHPCKSCVSTAMPLCHWPCSCYPNYALNQTDDWMNEIYPLWVAAHGIMIVTPVNWYHAPTGLKAMIDRLVCADGGNPDPTSTHGKHADQAKALELKGWPYPRHLAGRHFGLVVHGDSAGAEMLRRSLSDWLTDMALISAGRIAEAEGYVGYMEPYATSHEALDQDREFQEEVRNAARALGNAVRLARAGKYENPAAGLVQPDPK